MHFTDESSKVNSFPQGWWLSQHLSLSTPELSHSVTLFHQCAEIPGLESLHFVLGTLSSSFPSFNPLPSLSMTLHLHAPGSAFCPKVMGQGSRVPGFGVRLKVSPDLLLLLDIHATDKPAHHTWDCLPRDVQTVQEVQVLDSALHIAIHEALGNNWKGTKAQR